jgi:hypothetical protein
MTTPDFQRQQVAGKSDPSEKGNLTLILFWIIPEKQIALMRRVI